MSTKILSCCSDILTVTSGQVYKLASTASSGT